MTAATTLTIAAATAAAAAATATTIAKWRVKFYQKIFHQVPPLLGGRFDKDFSYMIHDD